MASAISVTLPQGIKASISPDTTATPMVENASVGARQVGTSLASTVINSTDTVMPPTITIAGQLTATGTINLRAGVDPLTGDADQDANGKRILAFEFWNLAASTDSIVIAPGSADPYPFFGSANDITINPGMRMSADCRQNDGAAPANRPVAVSATVKNIDVTIAGTSTLSYMFVLGD